MMMITIIVSTTKFLIVIGSRKSKRNGSTRKQIPFTCPLGLTAKLNFNVLKTVCWIPT